MISRLIIIVLLALTTLIAQEVPNSIKVNATSTIYIKANVVRFKITIQNEDKDPQIAFKGHKILEDKLFDLFDKYDIPDSSISYSLLNIRKSYNRDKENVFQTRQEVLVILNSIEDYTNFQIDLLENGFYEFYATYSTNNLEGAKEKGYKEALRVATEDAIAITKSLDKKLGDILEINTIARDIPHIDYQTSLTSSTISSGRNLTEIEQSVKIHTNLEVRFKIVDK